MIKALLQSERGPIIIAGLEEENVARLKADFPIDVPLTDFGLEIPGRLVILYGRTGAEIMQVMKLAGANTSNFEQDPTATAHSTLVTNESKVLIATVGLPRSGKSTWARTQAYPIVCPDEIRTALHGHRFIAEAEPFVWAICKVMVRALFGAGHQFVILDACNATRPRRDEWVSPEWALRLKHFDTDEQTCFDRAAASGDVEICPTIARMAAKFDSPFPDELLFT
jgi:predicted kinase